MTLIFVLINDFDINDFDISAVMCFVRTILMTLAGNLPITKEKNLEILDEAIVCQISIKRKQV